MTSPKLSHQIPHPTKAGEEIGRMYSRVPNGTPEVPSITTVMSMMNPQMEWWRGKCAGQEAIKVAPLIVQRQNELSPFDWRQKAKEIESWVSESSVRDMNVAARRGDAVHNYAEIYARVMLGESYDLQAAHAEALELIAEANSTIGLPNDDNIGYLDSVHRFFEDSKVRPIKAEGTVWNSTVGYAGTNDLLCEWDGEITILDWKTKKKLKDVNSHWYSPSIKTQIGMQLLAAYHGEEAYDEATDTWSVWEGKDATRFVGVALAPNGYEAVEVNPDPHTWETFKALKTVWDWYYQDTVNPESHLALQPLDATNPWGKSVVAVEDSPF